MVDDVKIEGLQRLKRKFDHLPGAVFDAAAEAMEVGAQELVDTQKRFAQPHRFSGKIIESIAWTWGEPVHGKQGMFRPRKVRTGFAMSGDNLKISVYTDAIHARWQEFGTVKFPAQPFFFPAYRALKKRINSRITRKANQAIKQAVQGR